MKLKHNKKVFEYKVKENILTYNARLICDMVEVPKLGGAPWGSTVGPLGGGRGLVFIRDIFIFNEIWAQDILLGTLLG
jgi:hypothetical protein